MINNDENFETSCMIETDSCLNEDLKKEEQNKNEEEKNIRNFVNKLDDFGLNIWRYIQYYDSCKQTSSDIIINIVDIKIPIDNRKVLYKNDWKSLFDRTNHNSLSETSNSIVRLLVDVLDNNMDTKEKRLASSSVDNIYEYIAYLKDTLVFIKRKNKDTGIETKVMLCLHVKDIESLKTLDEVCEIKSLSFETIELMLN